LELATQQNHLQQVREWLDLNVERPARPRVIKLSDIRFDWEAAHGSFRLTLDQIEVKNPFKLFIQMNGEVAFTPPMYVSPLGVPASYAAITLDEATETAINRALVQVFPKFFGYGRHQGKEAYIDALTPLTDRAVSHEEFVEKKDAIDAGSVIICETVF
jgi:hypothetical protein